MKRRSGQRIPSKLALWIEARSRYHLSDIHVQMARELGLNPKKLGSIANHDQERWKTPLPEFLGLLYRDRFGRESPECTLSMEELALRQAERKAERKRAKNARTEPGR